MESMKRIQDIQQNYQVSSLIAQVFEQNQCSNEQIEDVLKNQRNFSKNNNVALHQATQRILQAKQDKEKILIVGDYDCDGICATSIMKDVLVRLEVEHGYYIPNRFSEGYGINNKIVDLAHQKGYQLIITVDNGVSAFDTIEYAKQLELSVIVTDHHTIQGEGAWDILVHPQHMDEPFQALCGAGVALMISQVLLGEVPYHTVLAGIATIADMMPVFKENRVIIKRCIEELQRQSYMPIAMLCDRKVSQWDEKELSFQVIPKINAVGRMADLVNPNNVVTYLLATHIDTIESGASQIKQINNQRRKLSVNYAKQAKELLSDDLFHLVTHEDFHEGLVGLVANQICNETKRPVGVFAQKGDIYKGSVRGVEGFNLFTFFDELREYLHEFGGHSQAAGIQVKQENFESFKQAVQKKMMHVQFEDVVKRTIVASIEDCSVENISLLEQLRPFGQGFKSPEFEVNHFKVIDSTLMKQQYPKWNLTNGQQRLEVISFICKKESVNQSISSFIGTLGISEFRGHRRVVMSATAVKS